MSLSVAIITKNEEANIRRTLESVKWADEIVVVDSGSTDRTCDIAREYGAKVFIEQWKGFAKQKNSAIEKCTSDWILSLDADEEVEPALGDFLRVQYKGESLKSIRGSELSNAQQVIDDAAKVLRDWRAADPERFDSAYAFPRKNFFLGRWIRRGGFYPDQKIRLFKKGTASFQDRLVHEGLQVEGKVGHATYHLIHHAYPTLSGYIEHMNRYSDLGAQMVVEKKGKVGFSFINIVLRPIATFIYNYFFRLGFLDGKEGLLLHLYHSVYVSWKYAKAWELSRPKK
jgi:glycosyltransferase involved in cell wall biosynthesis